MEFMKDLLLFSTVMLITSCSIRFLFLKLNWNDTYKQLHKLFKDGFLKPAPLLYFLTIIVFCGGIGVWVSFLKESYDVYNITTYVFALTSSLMVDLIIVKDDGKFNDKDFMMFIISAFVFTLSVSFISSMIGNNFIELKWFMSIVSVICTWYLWWILSSCDAKFGFNQEVLRSSTIGDDPSEELRGKGLDSL